MRRTCRTRSRVTNARLDAAPLASVFAIHAPVCGPFVASGPAFPQHKADTIFVVHDHSFAFQQHADTPLSSKLRFDCRAAGRMIAPVGLGVDTDKPARPTLRDIMIQHCLACCSPSNIRCRQFFPSKFFGTTLSNIVSASRRFGLPFSPSSYVRCHSAESAPVASTVLPSLNYERK